jgi:hypothetical protein
MNPFLKDEVFFHTIFSNAPVVPEDAALVLFPQNARDRGKAYFKNDTVYPAEIRKRRFNRLAYITLEQFGFTRTFKYYFSGDENRWADLTYSFTAAVKPDRDSVKAILTKNITDISAPLIESIDENDAFVFLENYSCTQARALETAYNKIIAELAAGLDYLNIAFKLENMAFDKISEKIISDYEENEMARTELKKIEGELIRQKDEEEVRKLEAEIEKVKAEKEKELAGIQRQKDVIAHQNELHKKTMDLEADKKLRLLKAKNTSQIAVAHTANINRHDLAALSAIDDDYQKQIAARQAEIDRERENKEKDFDLQIKKLQEIKKTIADIDEVAYSELARKELLGIDAVMPAAIASSDFYKDIADSDITDVNIEEDGNENV